MAIQMLHTEGLNDSEARTVSDWWLADIEIDDALRQCVTIGRKVGWTAQAIAEKSLAIRTRYIELDMISIQQDLAERFGFDQDDDE